MPLDTDSFVNLKDPVRKLLQDTQSRLQDKAENYVIDAVGDALAKVGLGSKSRQGVLANLADAAVAGIASEFFGSFSSAVDRLTRADIQRDTGNFVDIDVFQNNEPQNAQDVGTTGTGSFVYPRDLNTFFIKFQFAKYERPSPHKVATFTDQFSVYLPIPRNLQEAHNVDIGTASQGIWASAADAVLDYTANPNLDQGGNSIMAGAVAFSGLARRISMLKEAAKTLGKTDDLFSIAEQLIGAIPNPNISAIFKGPTLRKHSFEWMFAPNNAKESEILRNIMRRFKQAALPNRVKDTNTFLQYPEICKIELHPWVNQGENNYLYTFKNCLIESVSFNYAPDSPVFVGGVANTNAPAFVSMRVNFIEIEYFTADQFGRKQETLTELYEKSQFERVREALVDAVFDVASTDFTATAPDVTDIGGVPTEGSDIIYRSGDGKYVRLRNGAWMRRESGMGAYSVYQNVPFSTVSDQDTTVAAEAERGGFNNDDEVSSIAALKLGADLQTMSVGSDGKGQIVLVDPDRTTVRQRTP